MSVNLDNYSANLDLARFVEHASQHVTAGGGGDATVVRADKTLAIRERGFRYAVFDLTVKVVDAPGDKAGGFSALFRSRANKEANNATRELFKSAVAKMFGGEDYIPESVRTAMKMNDYGKGRPLTARRILAVKVAIDKASRAECDQFFTSIQARAGSEGLVNLELPVEEGTLSVEDGPQPVEEGSEIRTNLWDLTKCAIRYKRETGCSNEEAVEALFTISKTAREKGQRLSLGDFSELAKSALRYKLETKCSYAEAIRNYSDVSVKANEILAKYNDWGSFRFVFENHGYVPKNVTEHEYEVLMDRLAHVAALLHLMDPSRNGTRNGVVGVTILNALEWANGPIATALGKNGEPRFLENVANFRYGLRLMDAFKALSKDVRKGRKPGQYDMAFEEKNWKKTRDYLFDEIARDETNLAALAEKAERDPDVAFSPYIDKVRERLNGDAGSNPQSVDLSNRVEDDD